MEKNKQPDQGFDLTARQATARMVAALRKAHTMPPVEQKDARRPKVGLPQMQIAEKTKNTG